MDLYMTSGLPNIKPYKVTFGLRILYIFMWPLVSLILNVQYMVTSGFPHALQFMVSSGLLTYLMWPLVSLQWLTSGKENPADLSID